MNKKVDQFAKKVDKALPYVKSIYKYSHPAVVTLCWNRLLYTQYSFHSLYENAGIPFDHYVIDNNSTDGTKEWLISQSDHFTELLLNPINVGIGGAFKQIIPYLERDNHEWFIATGNDCEVGTADILKKMSDIWLLSGGCYSFSPQIYNSWNKDEKNQDNIRCSTKELSHFKLGPYAVTEIDITGGGYQASSVSLFKEHMKLKGWKGANEYCRFLAAHKVQNLYIDELRLNSIESKRMLDVRYPNYLSKEKSRSISEGYKLNTTPGLLELL